MDETNEWKYFREIFIWAFRSLVFCANLASEISEALALRWQGRQEIGAIN